MELEHLNVKFEAHISEGNNCICSACHNGGSVMKVKLPDTRYHDRKKLSTKYREYWLCCECQTKLRWAMDWPDDSYQRSLDAAAGTAGGGCMKKFFCNGKKGFCETNDDCNDCDFFEDSGGEYRKVPVTNADRIRAMNDEELAIMFAMLKADLTRLDRPVRKYSGMDVNDNYDWLQQPAEEK